ncbi:SurA N-terminal domain-containing protein, partial [Escherichia coli]|uniref:SurA N-terminal domain-containing protein n=1 Tax=Escherichia coli TaxID=562 RepID=UPI003CF07B8F
DYGSKGGVVATVGDKEISVEEYQQEYSNLYNQYSQIFGASFESNDKKRYFEIKDIEHSHFICNNCSNIECIFEKPNFLLQDYKIENI